MKEIRKHFSKLGLMFFLGTLIVYGMKYGVNYLVQWLRPEWLENPDINISISMVTMYLISMPVMILLIKRVPAVALEKRSMKVWQFLLAVVMSFCITYCSNIAGTIVTVIIGMFKGGAVNNVMMNLTSSLGIPTMLVYMVICAPIMEELVFRKLIVDRTVRYGQGPAILISGLMFGLFHGNLNQFAYAFTLGMFLAFLYAKTGKIQYTIGIHMCLNFMGGIVATLVMRAMNFEGYMEAVASGSEEAMLEVMMASLPGWIGIMGLVFFMGMCIIAGIVLFIVFRKKFVLDKGEVEIPKGKGYVVLWNVGMVLFIAFWIVMIIRQLMM